MEGTEGSEFERAVGFGAVEDRVFEGFEERFVVVLILCCGGEAAEEAVMAANGKEGKVKIGECLEGQILREKVGSREDDRDSINGKFECFQLQVEAVNNGIVISFRSGSGLALQHRTPPRVVTWDYFCW